MSTAGAVGQNCNLTPLVICPTEVDGELQTGCNEMGCNGIPFHQRICLKGGTNAAKSGTCQADDIPTGNFGLLRFEGMAGGSDIRNLLAGTVNVCANAATWENGNKVGPVTQGIRRRFNDDKVADEYFGETNNYGDEATNPSYRHDSVNGPHDNPDGITDHRQVAIPVVYDCSTPDVVIEEATCLFLTQEVEQHGGSNEVYGELRPTCLKTGQFDPHSPIHPGPFDIVLYKSYGSDDS